MNLFKIINISSRIATSNHHGIIHAIPETGIGATFTITFPVISEIVPLD
ncbi:MAG: hypothetical protein LH478_04795 [Chitinophagaceae bacterium]|nr:hypothetical protein [Chitinophagaceae bacterium]